MNLLEKLDHAQTLPRNLRDFRAWIKKKRLRFSLNDLREVWLGRYQKFSLEFYKSCYQSAGVTLVLCDSYSGFFLRLILEDEEALNLMNGNTIDFSEIVAVFSTEERKSNCFYSSEINGLLS